MPFILYGSLLITAFLLLLKFYQYQLQAITMLFNRQKFVIQFFLNLQEVEIQFFYQHSFLVFLDIQKVYILIIPGFGIVSHVVSTLFKQTSFCDIQVLIYAMGYYLDFLGFYSMGAIICIQLVQITDTRALFYCSNNELSLFQQGVKIFQLVQQQLGSGFIILKTPMYWIFGFISFIYNWWFNRSYSCKWQLSIQHSMNTYYVVVSFFIMFYLWGAVICIICLHFIIGCIKLQEVKYIEKYGIIHFVVNICWC